MKMPATAMLRRTQQFRRDGLDASQLAARTSLLDQVEATLNRALAAHGIPLLSSLSSTDLELVALGVVLTSILGAACNHDPNNGDSAIARQNALEYFIDQYDRAEAER